MSKTYLDDAVSQTNRPRFTLVAGETGMPILRHLVTSAFKDVRSKP